jgi:hypothetical protein
MPGGGIRMRTPKNSGSMLIDTRTARIDLDCEIQ